MKTSAVIIDNKFRENMWSKNPVIWELHKTLYISVIFSWQIKEVEKTAQLYKGNVAIGGPAIKANYDLCKDTILKYSEYQELTPFNVLAMHNPLATFTTRGCIHKCPFCIVPKIEGEFRELDNWLPAPIVCDNNFLAASKKHIEKAIDRLKIFPYVDFNQGLEAKLFTGWHCEQFKKLKHIKIRFSFDSFKQEKHVITAIEMAKKSGFKDINIYVLIGYNDTPEEARNKLELVRKWGAVPNPMRYQPIDCEYKDSYVAYGWTQEKLKNMVRYYSKLRWLEHIPFEDYRGLNEKQLELMEVS